MYSDIDLTNYLQTSSTVSIKSRVICEWNLNSSETIKAIGNYQNRPTAANPLDSELPSTWNANENESTKDTNKWYGKTDYDTVIDGGYTDEGLTPVTFRVSEERQKSLMSLEDCFKKNRPRSGINKLRFFGKDKKLFPANLSDKSTFLNPRYYVSSKDDRFKYWSSYRTATENNKPIELGISGVVGGNDKLIQDAAPFVVYEYLLPTNKIVIKIQTNVGAYDSFPQTANADPFYYGSTPNYKSTPKTWAIQKYNGTNWIEIYNSNGDDVFTNDSAATGYFQLSYGLTNPEIIETTYKDNFVLLGTLSSSSSLPTIKEKNKKGQAYLVKTSDTDKGTIYIYNGGISDTTIDNYQSVTPTYGWYKSEESISSSQLFVKELDKTLSPTFVENSATVYREFDYIKGLRIVVTSMVNTNTTFDLIELSPRLEVDITDNVNAFSVKKFASDLGVSSMPVGQLLASTGNISLFDNNQVFNSNNVNSLLNIYENSILKTTFINQSLQLKFYEIASNIPINAAILSDTPQPTGTTNISITTENPHGFSQGDFIEITETTPNAYNGIWTAQSGTTDSTLIVSIGSNPGPITKPGIAIKSNSEYKNFYIPVKTLYSDGFPAYNDANRNISINLRDFSFYFESFIAPEIMLRNASLSFVVATLLDSIGFSNYKFLRISGVSDPVIPFFMVPPNKSVMQVLQDLATATQATMFFDEANNLIVMTKEYLVPSNNTRTKNITLYGDDKGPRKANILEIKSESENIYNDGKIVHYNRYIQKEVGDIQSVSRLDKNQTFEYQRSVLWSLEASEKATQSRNEQDVTTTAYALTAIPLAKTLSKTKPTVVNGKIDPLTNVINFGDGVYWMPRYSGYFYSNGEIIKYDAIEYTYTSGDDTNTVWIASNEEYQYYFSKVEKGGKLYKTGNVRIYAEPKYDSNGNMISGEVAKHGRAQFGTTIAEHIVPDTSSDIWWNVANNKKSFASYYDKLFGGDSTSLTKVIDDNKSFMRNKPPTISSKIKNFLSREAYSLTQRKTVYNEQIQSSGIVVTGQTFTNENTATGTIATVKKTLASEISYDTFGTRVRLLGDVSPIPSYVTLPYKYTVYEAATKNYVNKDGKIIPTPTKIGAQSGGMSIMTNSYGEGYYYELICLEYTDSEVVQDFAKQNTLFFYKMTMERDNNGNITNDVLTPTILYKSFENILPDTGKFASKVLKAQQEDSVYDIAITVDKTNTSKWSFGIYFNGQLIQIVQDSSPVTNGVNECVSLFVRGSSQALFENVFAMRRTLTTEQMKTTGTWKTDGEYKDKFGNELAGYYVSKFNDVPSLNIFDITKTSSLSVSSKYALSPLVQTGFLSKLSTTSIPETQIFYEEFGAVMRECAYFNIKFDKAYPALTSLISPIPASLGGYIVSGYNSTPYGAEFLVFNTTDSVLDLGANQSYEDNLSITGVTFTQENAKDLTVDEFLGEKGSYTQKTNLDIVNYKNQYTDIKNNRLLYGTKSFIIDSPYIQNEDSARNLMKFFINRLSKPRKAVGTSVFGMSIIQLGDIVNFYYDPTKTLPNSITNNNYVVYASEYQMNENGPSTILYLSEVI